MRGGVLIAASLLTAIAPGAALAAESCEAQLAATNGLRDGQTVGAVPGDGAVFFLRSGGRDRTQRLFRFDPAGSGAERVLDDGAGGAALTVEERARRERARITSGGIAEFELSKDGKRLLVPIAGQLAVMGADGSNRKTLPGSGWISPHLSPDGSRVAAVRDDDLHVIDVATGTDRTLTSGGTDVVTHGLAEFAAEEELDRLDGFWWAPDGSKLVVETADSSKVERHFIADPGHPEKQPVDFRYPRTGTDNADVTLAVVDAAGGKPPVPIKWDRMAFPYVVRVVWPEHGALSLVVLNREQTEERVLAVDPAGGATRTLWTETDPAWVDAVPFEMRRGPLELPHWLDDGSGFLWASERSGDWRLELHRADGSLDHVVTPAGFRFSELLDVDPRDGGSVVVAGGTDPMSELVFRVKLAGGAAVPLAAEPGLHAARFGTGHDLFVDRRELADGTNDAVLRRASDGRVVATLPSKAEAPVAPPAITWTHTGKLGFDTAILRPRGARLGQKLPVVLSVYGGPGFKVVRRETASFFADQCLADRGAIVLSLDGRGTPGHGSAFEHATKYDLIDAPLADQVEGLRAAATRIPGMDLSRVAVMGWSFGGYFSVMATARRPDVFAGGVAGAPPVEWQDYDTAYTERYLGLPQAHPDAYRVSDVLSYAGGLARPLLIVHGLTDDNVYFENTVKLTDALLRAGKPYELVLLPGTHLLSDPALRMAETVRVEQFLHRTIGTAAPPASP